LQARRHIEKLNIADPQAKRGSVCLTGSPADLGKLIADGPGPGRE
jgi:hypothetical protein